jgi:D-alanyl-D-alanine carboxypeptidase
VRRLAPTLVASVMAVTLLPSGAAMAAPRTAAMAIDANTGAVLHNYSGDAKRYPASLTKMMTLYMAFELIERGRMSYDTKITMTEHAAAATPSKLGLKAGSKIRAIDAMKALVTKSANDVAIALAQHIGGTESNFARLMTRKARQIGMKSTVFKNASGLPNDEQFTTARDMLTLALRLQDEFPQHYKLFKTRSFSYAGKTYRNHNRLLGRYRGVDGIKTGYTRASGFNLVTNVERDGKHVVAAVFGGKSSRVRNARMVSLLNKALKKASTKKTRRPARFVQPPQPVAAKPPLPRQPPRPVLAVAPKPAKARSSEAAAGPTVAVARVRPMPIGPELRQQSAPTGFAAAGTGSLPRFVPAALQPSTLQAQAAALERGSPSPRPQQPQAAAPPRGPFEIQIGAYSDSADAERHMDSARRRAASLLGAYPAVAVPVQKGGSKLYRARFRGFDATAAASTCSHLRRIRIDCFVVRTE